MDKKQAKAIKSLFFQLNRPRHIHPRKNVKWRLLKKWFNRYQKARYIGAYEIIEKFEGGCIRKKITDIKIVKDGKHQFRYRVSFEEI